MNDEMNLNLLLDGLLSDDEEQALLDRFAHEPALRARYLQLVNLHAELAWSSAVELQAVLPERAAANELPTRPKRWPWLAAALAPVLLIALGYLMWPRVGAPACEIVAVQGAVTFIAADAPSFAPQVRQQLPAGRFLLEGESAALQARQPDGTLLSLTGNAELSLSAEPGRPLVLQRGQLTAEVSPQQRHALLLVQTPTALVEFHGTVLTVASESEQTHVQVDSGQVRVRRLVDGQTIDLPEQRYCTATLNTRDDFRPVEALPETRGWQHDFAAPPPKRWKGEWVAAAGDVPAHVRAVPCIVGQDRERNTPLVNWGFTARRLPEISLGQLGAQGEVRLRLRLEREQGLRLMLGVHQPDGKFGGNFDVHLTAAETRACVGQFADITVPLARFIPINGKLPKLAAEMKPYLLLVTSYEADAGLCAARIEITAE